MNMLRKLKKDSTITIQLFDTGSSQNWHSESGIGTAKVKVDHVLAIGDKASRESTFPV
jgi:hypothetical protein